MCGGCLLKYRKYFDSSESFLVKKTIVLLNAQKPSLKEDQALDLLEAVSAIRYT